LSERAICPRGFLFLFLPFPSVSPAFIPSLLFARTLHNATKNRCSPLRYSLFATLSPPFLRLPSFFLPSIRLLLLLLLLLAALGLLCRLAVILIVSLLLSPLHFEILFSRLLLVTGILAQRRRNRAHGEERDVTGIFVIANYDENKFGK